MQIGFHKDPTFNAVVEDEVDHKRCAICTRRRVLVNGGATCGVGYVYPICLDAKEGFCLDMGEADAT